MPELKDAVRKLVKEVGGVKRAAEYLGRSPSQVQRYTSPHHSDELGIEQALILERHGKTMPVTQMLAQLQGGAVLRPVHHHGHATDGFLVRYARAWQSAVRIHEHVAQAIVRDSEIARRDMPTISRHLHETIACCADVLAFLHARQARRGDPQVKEHA
jgi:hypothetical protein